MQKKLWAANQKFKHFETGKLLQYRRYTATYSFIEPSALHTAVFLHDKHHNL